MLFLLFYISFKRILLDKNMSYFQEKMLDEINNLITAYNEVSGLKLTFDKGDKDSEKYKDIVRNLGNYIYRDFNDETWRESSLVLTQKDVIRFSFFKDTVYENRVHSFLLKIKNAFFQSIDNEVIEFLEKTSVFTEEEKNLCREFYERIKVLNNAIKHTTFSNTSNDPQNLKNYHDELRSYDEFIKMVVNTPSTQRTIQTFDKVIRDISSSKKHTDISF